MNLDHWLKYIVRVTSRTSRTILIDQCRLCGVTGGGGGAKGDVARIGVRLSWLKGEPSSQSIGPAATNSFSASRCATA
jgi:hypothetical protein